MPDESTGEVMATPTERPDLSLPRVSMTDQGRVTAFYQKMLGRMPTVSEATDRLYEEMNELWEALDGVCSCGCQECDTDSSPGHLLGEMCDVIFTINGLAAAYGWNLTGAFNAICDANMRKTTNVGGAGKIQKPADFVPADLRPFIG